MRLYVIVSGIIFALLFAAHVARVFVEGHNLAERPEYLIITVFAAAMSIWAFSSLRRPR